MAVNSILSSQANCLSLDFLINKKEIIAPAHQVVVKIR